MLCKDVGWVGSPRYIVQLDVPCCDLVACLVIVGVDMFGAVIAYVVL